MTKNNNDNFIKDSDDLFEIFLLAIWFLIWVIITLSVFSFFWLIKTPSDFEKYCLENQWQFLRYSDQCYYDLNYYDYFSDLEKAIFQNNLLKEIKTWNK